MWLFLPTVIPWSHAVDNTQEEGTLPHLIAWLDQNDEELDAYAAKEMARKVSVTGA
jgi:hypothetical protein